MISIAAQLDNSRQALLDLSTRNHLLSIPKQRKSAKIIEIRDGLSAKCCNSNTKPECDVFGHLWQGIHSNWPPLVALVA